MLRKRMHRLKLRKQKLKPARPATVVASIRLQPKLKQRVQELADLEQRTFNSLIVRLLTKFVKHEGRDSWKDE